MFVFTYHGLLTSLIGQTVGDDLLFVTHLEQFMSGGAESTTLPPCEFADVDVMIIDEAQDMSSTSYYNSSCCTLSRRKTMCSWSLLVTLGRLSTTFTGNLVPIHVT